jgi:ribosomal protein S13
MRVTTILRALPGIGAAIAARLMREAGIGATRRADGLTTGQRERLLAAVGALDAKLSARRGRRHDSGH